MGAISVRLDGDVLERLDRLGGELARPRSWLIAQAIQRCLDYEEWFIDAVREGIESAEAGRTVEHGEVVRWIDSWRSEAELDRPK